MFKKVLIGAVAVALSSGAAYAGENKFTKEEGTGLATGAVAGALVGGPVGAMIGLMVGGTVGDSIGTHKRAEQAAVARADQLQQDLVDTRIALAKASERTGGDEMLDALAARLHADVMFRTGTADLTGDVQQKIADLGQLLGSHPQLEIQLHGFADPRGKSAKNLELSLERASAVRDALIAGGAAPEQIRIAAHGEDLTTAPKDDLEAYAWERRVSISIRPTSPAAVAQSR
ncbi:MAG TPA: OmpA family protein [Steroidobacteraceae bacterium]|jgi:outer membrane protein OmpA-like peptidoglycan-associated protein